MTAGDAKRPTGRPRKAGSEAARQRRLVRAAADADMGYMDKKTSMQRFRKTVTAVAVTADQPVGAFATARAEGVHGSLVRGVVARALSEHEKNALEGRLHLSGAIPEAAHFLRRLVRGEEEGATVENRVQAAKIILTAGGILGEIGKGAAKGRHDDPNEMSADELRLFIRAGMEQLRELQTRRIDGESRVVNPDVPDAESNG